MNSITALLHGQYGNSQNMVILCSSSIGFVENNLVSRIGRAALDISGFLKLKELKFSELKEYFSEFSTQDCLKIYSILGGIPGLWNYFDQSLSVSENICQNILSKNAFLFEEGKRYVKEELREGSVYYSLLSALAEGKNKLNELYLHTGFSRAKISVYLKNLMELEIVEKVFSIDISGQENLRKGIYQISNHFVNFWFRYLYPNMSDECLETPVVFYQTYIAESFEKYCGIYFSKICREYLNTCDHNGQLPFKINKSGIFDGKNGMIDYVGQEASGQTLMAFCQYDKPMFTYEDYQQLFERIKQTKLEADYLFLFSGTVFDEKLHLEATVKDTVRLIEMDSL